MLDILSEVVGETVQVLRAHPVLATHDWDSLASLEALAQLESRFGVVLDCAITTPRDSSATSSPWSSRPARGPM